MQGGVLEQARQAAAAARTDQQRARGRAGRLPVRRYRGVTNRGDRYVAEIMDAEGLCPMFLGSYATPEEAAHAYDAAARVIHGDKAKPNFPEPPSPPQPPRGAAGGQRPLLGHARARVRQTFCVPPQASSGDGPAAFSQFVYRSSGAGSSSAISFSAAAAGGSSNDGGGGLFFGMAASSMIGPEPEVVPMLTYAARSALSSTDMKSYKAVVVDADPKLVIIIESDSDGEPVVEDNFTAAGAGASTSSSAARARPAVPPLRLKDLMEADVVRRSAEEGAP